MSGVTTAATDGRLGASLTISDRWDDVSLALSMVHDRFVEAGYMTPVPSGKRMILPYLTPGAAFFLVHRENEAAGAAVLIPDGPLGLPSDRAFVEENDALRSERRPLFECGSLVVNPGRHGMSSLIVAMLMAGAARVLAEHEDGRVVVSATPGSERFYADLFGFVRVSDERPLYGAPAVLLETDTWRVRDHVSRRRSAPQRLVGELTTAVDPDWLDDRRAGEPWPEEPVTALLGEQHGLERVFGPLGVLGARLGWGANGSGPLRNGSGSV